jgi:hypothetical protein
MNSNPVRAVLGLLVVGAFVYFTFFAPGGFGSKATQGNIEVYYKDGATQAEAEKLAGHLARVWGDAPERRSVQLTKNGETPRFRMVVKPEYHNDPKFMTQLGIFGAQLSRDVFNGVPIELEACDDHFNTVKAVPIPPAFRNGILKGKIELFYGEGVVKVDAEKLMASLEKEFANAPVPLLTVTLTKKDTTYTVSMPYDPEKLKAPEIRAALKTYCTALSVNDFGGAPVEWAACDPSFAVIEVIKP